MDLLTSSPPPSQLQLSTDMLNSNLMSFISPARLPDGIMIPNASSHQTTKPCDIVLQEATSPTDIFGSKTSTPFDGEAITPRFKFENQLVDIIEDPFDIVERKAVQFTNNDPFDVVSAAAAAYTSVTANTSNSLMNCAFTTSGSNSAELTSDASKLNLNNTNDVQDAALTCTLKKTSPLQINGLEDDEHWLSNEHPPWEKSQTFFEDAKDDMFDNDEADEVFDVIKRVSSSDFPKLIASVADELDTRLVSRLQLRSPLLKTSLDDEQDDFPPIEPLQVPSSSLRSVDLSFFNATSETAAQKTPLKQPEDDNLNEWKQQILARASGFVKDKRVVTSAKPFSQPLVSLDINSPAGKISTPARVAIAAPLMTNLPTPKFRSRLMKPRSYGVNKENQ